MQWYQNVTWASSLRRFESLWTEADWNYFLCTSISNKVKSEFQFEILFIEKFPTFFRWRILLLVTSVCLAVGACYWLGDPITAEVSFIDSLMNHPFFSFSTLFIVALFLLGAHRRVVAPSIFVQRTREVLYDFAMDCDDTGKLILKPRPATA